MAGRSFAPGAINKLIPSLLNELGRIAKRVNRLGLCRSVGAVAGMKGMGPAQRNQGWTGGQARRRPIPVEWRTPSATAGMNRPKTQGRRAICARSSHPEVRHRGAHAAILPQAEPRTRRGRLPVSAASLTARTNRPNRGPCAVVVE